MEELEPWIINNANCCHTMKMGFRVLPIKYTLYVNIAKYKILKNHKKVLRSPTVFKTKRKNINRFITFYFLLYLLWIVQVSRELLSSQWKPPCMIVKTPTLKSSHFGKRPYALNQIRTAFSGPSVSKIVGVGSQGPPGHDIVPVLHDPSNGWASNLFFFSDKFEDIHIMISSSAHEFLTI